MQSFPYLDEVGSPTQLPLERAKKRDTIPSSAAVPLSKEATFGNTSLEMVREASGRAAMFFHLKLLHDPSAQHARRYLQERNITPRMAKDYNLGYAPDPIKNRYISKKNTTTISSNSTATNNTSQRRPSKLIQSILGDSGRSLVSWLSSKSENFTLEEISDAGLAIKGKYSPYDRFRDRLIFPIRNIDGWTIALAGRSLPALPTDDLSSSLPLTVAPTRPVAKYINGPTTIGKTSYKMVCTCAGGSCGIF
jgi:DNA primase